MKPLKSKELIPEVCKDLNLEQDVVQDVIKFYWKNIRKNLSDMSHFKVHVTNLGDFNVKHWKLTPKIENLEKWEIENNLKGNTLINTRFKIAETLFALKDVRKKIEEENQRKQFITLHKKTKYV